MPDVILPALNEAEALPWVLRRLPPGYRAIVVDNGSTDGTAAVAAAHGAMVVTEQQRGFGAACWRGLSVAEAEVVCFMDADASFDPAELPVVAGPVLTGAADLMLGARRHERGAWPLHARLANRALAFEIRRRTGVPLRDLGPMRAARRNTLLELGMTDRRSGWPLEMVLRAVAADWKIDEVPVGYRPRVGRSKVTGTVRGTVRAVLDMRRTLRSLGPGPGDGPDAGGDVSPALAGGRHDEP
ncbi:MAG: glycosyltransferase family 2 protein [Acidimicrobiales bacterium]|nr:glycosyltransferase family 2 protein [Acidimicrobiales bacterium]